MWSLVFCGWGSLSLLALALARSASVADRRLEGDPARPRTDSRPAR
jgi:hypothetical protein